jgi:hypothetical protein
MDIDSIWPGYRVDMDSIWTSRSPLRAPYLGHRLATRRQHIPVNTEINPFHCRRGAPYLRQRTARLYVRLQLESI